MLKSIKSIDANNLLTWWQWKWHIQIQKQWQNDIFLWRWMNIKLKLRDAFKCISWTAVSCSSGCDSCVAARRSWSSVEAHWSVLSGLSFTTWRVPSAFPLQHTSSHKSPAHNKKLICHALTKDEWRSPEL